MVAPFRVLFLLIWVWGPGSYSGLEKSQTLIYLEFSGSTFVSLSFNLFISSPHGFHRQSVRWSLEHFSTPQHPCGLSPSFRTSLMDLSLFLSLFLCFFLCSFVSYFILLSLLSFQGHTHGIWQFPGQGSNRSCSCQPTSLSHKCQI